MNKLKKFSLIVLFNIIILAIIIFICDILIYKYYTGIYYTNHPSVYIINKFKYMPYLPEYITDLESYFNGRNNLFFGRTPDGQEYSDKMPVILFGCSYAFGQHLDYNQTFSYKLAHILKRPVYNRAMSGSSFQHMYMQSESDSLYKTIKDTDTVIYVMIGDHYRRSMLYYFDVLDLHLYPHYAIRNGKLKHDNYKNHLINFFKSLYIVKHFNHVYVEKYVNNSENADKITDDAVLYFIESRKNLEQHYGKKLKFYIILYEDWDIMYKKELKRKLESAGFPVFSTQDLTNEDLRTEKYQMKENHHPSEAAWDLLTPKIIEKLNLKAD